MKAEKEWCTVFIARQPIFNKSIEIYGYELLYRSGSDAKNFGNVSSLSATASVLEGLLEQGISRVVGKARAFVNFDYDFIMSDTIELFDVDTLVIEVLEDVKIDDKLIERLTYLNKKGYRIALDDFEEKISSYPLVSMANIIKYDIMITPFDVIRDDVKKALSEKKIILAEKIETDKEFQTAVEMGFQLFQGYFFSKPKIVGGSNIRRTSKAQYARIIKELNMEEPSYEIIASIIESDVNLAYRVMRVMSNKKNSDTFNSIKRALVRMGLEELKRWISLLLLQDISKDKPTELMKMSLIRSRFGEYIAKKSIFAKRKEEVSMMCLFSVLDAILDCTVSEALEGIPLSEDVFNALVFSTGDLSPIYKLILAYEKGDWNGVRIYADIVKIDTELLYDGYLESIRWATDVLGKFE